MNNKAHLRPKDFDSNGDIIPMSWKDEKGVTKEVEFKVITRGKCMLCGKELTEGLFFCKECEKKGGAYMREDEEDGK